MRKLIQRELRDRTVPRVRDLRRSCRMEKRSATDLYSKATRAETGTAAANAVRRMDEQT